ncbi:MAG: RHS repeat-associated core domain-containing protein [Bacteroidales bacterium]|nr:RHS repeat-associated core domain-containing protein [Bacteroidales bacterium]
MQCRNKDIKPYPYYSSYSTCLLTDHSGNVVDSMSFDAWGNRRNYNNWHQKDNSVHLIDRGFTMHQHLDSFNLINMEGRMYDPVVAQFLSPDPYVQAPEYTQGLNRYSYCMNSPLMYTDPDGEFWHIVIGAAIGGVVNVATNWNNLDGFWQGLASFGAGAASGALTATLGPGGAALGGMITGATNSLIAQTGKNFSGFNNVNWAQTAMMGGVGAFSGVVGYVVGQWASTNVGDVVINGLNVTSPVLKGAIGGAIGGAAGGYAGGFTSGMVFTGDASQAHQMGMQGMWSGMGIGAGTGAMGGYFAAKEAGINPWTGKPNNPTTPAPQTPYEKGQEGVNRAIDEIIAQGGNVLNKEVTLEVNGVRVRVDIAADFNGTIQLIEVKNGPSASFTPNQKVVYPQMLDGVKVIPRGANASTVWPGQVGQPTSQYFLIIKWY